jgi:threonine/homoserine/homoserine lactone efflux protein
LYFLTFLPQSADPGTANAALRPVVLGLILALLSVIVFSLITLFSGLLGYWLSRNPATPPPCSG